MQNKATRNFAKRFGDPPRISLKDASRASGDQAAIAAAFFDLAASVRSRPVDAAIFAKCGFDEPRAKRKKGLVEC